MGKVPVVSTLIFVHTQISLNHSVQLVERSLHAKNQINPFILLTEHRPVTDRHKHRQTQAEEQTQQALITKFPSFITVSQNVRKSKMLSTFLIFRYTACKKGWGDNLRRSLTVAAINYIYCRSDADI